MKAKERITGFDSLRFFMVFLVIALHSAMTYMEFVPAWWYVIDAEKSLPLAYAVVFLDSFPMTALFFLAGYFAPPSFDRRGARAFIKDKFTRIGIPWLLGLALVAPFFAHASLVAVGLPSPGIAEFIQTYFFGAFYQQAHYWFLGALFVFLAVYAAYADVQERGSRPFSISPGALIAALWIVSTATYILSGRYVKPAVEWLNAGYVIYFQPARIVGYIGVFALGIHAWRSGWFKQGGWTPGIPAWGLLSVASSVLLLAFTFVISPGKSPLFALMAEAVFYNATSISVTLFLTSLFIRLQRRIYKFTSPFDADSYAIYWLHQIVLMPMLYMMKSWDVSAYLKWGSSLPLTVLICDLLARFVLKKLPLVGRVF
ncbi:MAG: acyltransferase family protein [Synergistaceae bacterium]|nr:acyltransferase family protein [Synergistaceae bacterium]